MTRYRQWRQASFAVIVTALVVGLLAAAVSWGQPVILLGLAVPGMVANLVNEWVNWFGVCLTRDGALVLTRVNPAVLNASLGNHPV